MGKSYANVTKHAGRIFEIYYDELGIRKKKSTRYRPTFAMVSKDSNAELTTMDGKHRCQIIQCKSNKQFRESTDQYGDTMDIYNNIDPVYQYLAEEYPGELEVPKLKIYTLDIEVYSEEGFPDPEQALHPINAITVHDTTTDIKTTFALGEYETDKLDVVYRRFADEISMLAAFIQYFQDYPDIVTGWNNLSFDIPYLVNRINRIIGYGEADKLSPFGKVISMSKKNKWGQKNQIYRILGVTILDYLELYKKFAFGSRESYSLEYIAQYELGAGKVDYHNEFDNLADLATYDHQKFIEYNIMDVELVRDLNRKLGYIELAVSIAYKAKCKFEDVFSPVKTWDVYIYNYLRKAGIAIPPIPEIKSGQAYAGAYVKEPIKGMHEWVVSFDVRSEYPSCLISNNISPEAKVKFSDLPDELGDFANKVANRTIDRMIAGEIDTSILKKYDLAMAPNQVFFKRDTQGVLSKITQEVFEERVSVRVRIGKLYKSGDKSEETSLLIKRLDQTQKALKILINSLYGAYASAYFRYNDVDLALAITSMGQYCIRAQEKAINDFLVENFGSPGEDFCMIIDTDSVIGETIIHVNGEDIRIDTLWDKATLIDDRDGQMVGVVDNMNARSFNTEIEEIEEKKINYVMRHKVKKRMFKITVDGKSVVVTTD